MKSKKKNERNEKKRKSNSPITRFQMKRKNAPLTLAA